MREHNLRAGNQLRACGKFRVPWSGEGAGEDFCKGGLLDADEYVGGLESRVQLGTSLWPTLRPGRLRRLRARTFKKSFAVKTRLSHGCTSTSTPSLWTSSCTASGVSGQRRSHIRSGSSRRIPSVSFVFTFLCEAVPYARRMAGRSVSCERRRTVMVSLHVDPSRRLVWWSMRESSAPSSHL